MSADMERFLAEQNEVLQAAKRQTEAMEMMNRHLDRIANALEATVLLNTMLGPSTGGDLRRAVAKILTDKNIS